MAIEIHGFADASQHALAAVIYLRVLTELDDVRVSLVSAKTKVAPLKHVTIPRLELSAAVLLVRQVHQLRETLDYPHAPIHLWTDSTVALTWIKGHPSRWKDFVRNRVTFIQEFSNARWHHVSGKENPADLASRGVPPHLLQHQALWWKGPPWLHRHSTSWPSSSPTIDVSADLEERATTCVTATGKFREEIWELINRYSSLTKLLRVTAWVRRVVERFRSLATSFQSIITPSELDSALQFWIQLTQNSHFAQEIRLLKQGRPLDKSSSLSRLMPTTDSHGLLRISGRLYFSQLNPVEQQPFILPRASRLTTLIIEHYHRKTLHGGPQLTLSTIRQKFWIIGGRTPV